MAEIIPNGKLYLLKNLKIDNTYENTIIFDNKQAQYSYFISKCPNTATYGFTDVNYQRVNKGVIAIKGMAENIMKCNYMMFQNSLIFQEENNTSTTTTFDWVYAFITDVKYKSTNCCDVYYEIDVLQTFMFSYDLGSCFVEREHTPTDVIGEHIIDEGLPVGDYEYTELQEYTGESGTPLQKAFVDDEELSIIVACTFDDQYQPAVGGDYAGFFSGLVYHIFNKDHNGILDCINFIANSGQQVNSIVSVFLAPKHFADEIINGTSHLIYPITDHYIPYVQFTYAFDGYTPKNNKLYTYPYNYFYLHNGVNDVAEYHVEKFAIQTVHEQPDDEGLPCVQVREFLDFSCSPTLVAVPCYYERLNDNFINMITCGPFPQLSWQSDTYKAWIAQNGTSLILSSITGAIGAVTGASSMMVNANASAANGATNVEGGVIAGAINIAGSLINNTIGILDKIQYAKKLPNQAHGNINSAQLLSCLGRQRFYAYRRFIRKDYAKSIDDFFTMYGYKVNKIETPNRKARRAFTYIKTVNCFIVPKNNESIPKVYADAITTIYNNGVRTWINGDNIGDYTVNNSPLT